MQGIGKVWRFVVRGLWSKSFLRAAHDSLPTPHGH
jgi:hypothetical protein